MTRRGLANGDVRLFAVKAGSGPVGSNVSSPGCHVGTEFFFCGPLQVTDAVSYCCPGYTGKTCRVVTLMSNRDVVVGL